jgi:hypothetical protein
LWQGGHAEQDKTESLQGAQNGKGADIFYACDQEEEEEDSRGIPFELHTHDPINAHERHDANGLKETRRSEVEGGRQWGKREVQLQAANAILRKGWAGMGRALNLSFPHQDTTRRQLASSAMAVAAGSEQALHTALARQQEALTLAPDWLRDTCVERAGEHWERFYARCVCV